MAMLVFPPVFSAFSFISLKVVRYNSPLGRAVALVASS